jgi:hypothetical protein
MKSPLRSHPIRPHAPLQGSASRINNMRSVLTGHVVGDHKGFLMEEHMAVKIMENEEPGIVKPRTPERIRNPGI